MTEDIEAARDLATIRRLAFYSFSALVAVNALLGIAAFVGDYRNEGEVLGTSGVLSVAVLGVLANAPAVERGRLWPVALLGIAATAVWAAMLIYAIWDDFHTGEAFEQWMWGSLFVGLGASYVSIVGSIRLTARQAPLRVIADLFAGAAVVFAVVAIADQSGDLSTAIAICVIVAVAFAVVLPVLGRLNRAERTTVALADFCPRCGAPVDHVEHRGYQRCNACGASFSVELPG